MPCSRSGAKLATLAGRGPLRRTCARSCSKLKLQEVLLEREGRSSRRRRTKRKDGVVVMVGRARNGVRWRWPCSRCSVLRRAKRAHTRVENMQTGENGYTRLRRFASSVNDLGAARRKMQQRWCLLEQEVFMKKEDEEEEEEEEDW